MVLYLFQEYVHQLFIIIINLFMRNTESKREAEAQAEGEAGSPQGTRHRTRSWVSRITPSAEGRHQTAEPPRRPHFK